MLKLIQVNVHLFLTQGVGGGQPSAAKMYKLKWNEELAEIAQAWADQCTWKHDKQRVGLSFTPHFRDSIANVLAINKVL